MHSGPQPDNGERVDSSWGADALNRGVDRESEMHGPSIIITKVVSQRPTVPAVEKRE